MASGTQLMFYKVPVFKMLGTTCSKREGGGPSVPQSETLPIMYHCNSAQHVSYIG